MTDKSKQKNEGKTEGMKSKGKQDPKEKKKTVKKASTKKSKKEKGQTKKDERTTEKKEGKKKEDIVSPEEKIAIFQDKYLRLSADFDNYRKRTLKEKTDLTKSANAGILLNLLPVLDDFERALKSMEDTKGCKEIKDGIDLIYNKFGEFLKSSGIKEIDAMNTKFDTEIHEAVTKIPAPSKKLKGKVVDVIQKGYYLNEKIIRYPKVVIGE